MQNNCRFSKQNDRMNENAWNILQTEFEMTQGMLVRAHVAHDSGMTFCDHKIFPLQKVN